MGYDILAKIIELTDSEEAIEQRLKDVASLLAESFAFDQCALYLWDDEKRVFNLTIVAGDEVGCEKKYKENEGLAGFTAAKGKPLLVAKSNPDRETWRGTVDKGIAGFTTIVCCPIKNSLLYGMLYLKNKKKKSISSKAKKLFPVIAMQIATAIKNYQCIINLKDFNTRMKDMQARLVHAEKLLALGEMAATLAHEIKNPLMSIGGFAKRLHQQLGQDSSHMIYVDRIVKEVERLEKLMEGIVRFSVKSDYEFSSEDINKITEEAISFFEDDFKGSGINVVKSLSINMPRVEIDRQQLQLVFSNLLANAIQAMENGGTLTIKTRHEDNWVITEINDTGGGIDPAIIGNIFNPFYTTKERGTGLGLAITHSIITNHKGMIEVNNNLGVGVTFVVKLPVAIKEDRILEVS